LLNQPREAILAALPDAAAQRLATTLCRAISAAQDRQATYRAADFAVATGVDPRLVDPLLVRLAERDLLLYRAYSRGITVMTAPALEDREGLAVIAQQFATRYERFEERLQAMLDYVTLRPGQGRCRSAYLVNCLTGGVAAPRCGQCDLCSPTGEHLPWDPGVRLYGEPLQVDPRLALLGAVRDHDGWFGRWTLEKMLLGIPQTTYHGQVQKLSPSALASDHFGMLDGMGIDTERLRRTLDVLIEGGYVQWHERLHRGAGTTYLAVALTQKGRDALAGGVDLPEFYDPEAVA
jgi:hypothetical protein